METTLGGGRLGSGNKQEISYRNYERSTHDLSYLWRSSMSPGTLVPFMCKLALPGDHFKIELNTEVMTLPTIGPLFGSYKIQLDVFEVPVRLYNAKLHMNKLGIGMDMASIFLPQITLLTNNHANYVQTFDDNEQVNASSLMKYLGVSGLGKIAGNTNPAPRDFNAVPLLAYWDIYKNYYSNKQEEIGYFIHTEGADVTEAMTPIDAEYNYTTDILGVSNETALEEDKVIVIYYPSNSTEPAILSAIPVHAGGILTTLGAIADNIVWDNNNKTITCTVSSNGDGQNAYIDASPTTPKTYSLISGLRSFDLLHIDEMRDLILKDTGASAFKITSANDLPYSCFMKSYGTNENLKYSIQFNQEGLGIKTYQSDLFNNWINTEWIDGATGVSELSKVLTTGDSFTIDALNIAQKVYTMLNRIAISGGTYDDWLDAVYTHERIKSIDSPVYLGSLIKELAFQEVISNAATADEPLGTLAGRGRLTSKHKGGFVQTTVNEPSYLIGICSITPRIEYSQGNEWDMNLKTFDDFHKPALDAIGFQDLIVEQLLWTDSSLESSTGVVTTHSLGKQPAWINYMTSVNKVFGAFAEQNNSMFMTLNRRYEKDTDGTILDGTTYIDPTKFNQIFSEVSLDAQNFWMQISVNIEARRKMSAKVIPNL